MQTLDWAIVAINVVVTIAVLIFGHALGARDGYRKGFRDGERAARGYPVGYTPNGAQRRSSGGMAHPSGQAHINVREETNDDA